MPIVSATQEAGRRIIWAQKFETSLSNRDLVSKNKNKEINSVATNVFLYVYICTYLSTYTYMWAQIWPYVHIYLYKCIRKYLWKIWGQLLRLEVLCHYISCYSISIKWPCCGFFFFLCYTRDWAQSLHMQGKRFPTELHLQSFFGFLSRQGLSQLPRLASQLLFFCLNLLSSWDHWHEPPCQASVVFSKTYVHLQCTS